MSDPAQEVLVTAADRDGATTRAAEAEIYALRFPEAERARRMAMWREIGAYLQRYIPEASRVLDIGAGDGELITSIEAAERWASDLREPSTSSPANVRFVRSSGLDLLGVLEPGSFDRVLMSNYLEHLGSRDDVVEQLRVVRGLLRPGGQVIILQPNIALVGAAYWDFIDHKVALTERSLTEAVELAGLVPVTMIRRFLPYSTKGRLPAAPLLVRLYLRVRPAWWLMGRQTLMIAQRPTG